MQIEANEVRKGDVINDERDGEIMVKEVWSDRHDGLGCVIKGTSTDGEKLYFRRFLNSSQYVEKIERAV